MDIATALAQSSIPRSERRLFLAEILQQSHAWIAAHDEAGLSEGQAQQFHRWVTRREAGEPVAYILGWKEFYGRPFRVSPAVLIPRPETELLVDWALEKLSGKRVLDLGCGSGALAITVAAQRPSAHVTAVDLSADALAVARTNAQKLLPDSDQVSFLEGSWFEPVGERQFDLIMSNPPYVARPDPHLKEGDVRYEPITALVGGEDGLADLRQIIGRASTHLVSGGWLLVEHGYDQQVAVNSLFHQAGFAGVECRHDLAGWPRCTGGYRP